MPRNRASASLQRVVDGAERNAANKQALIDAPNWKTPIIVDVVIGSVVFIVGLTLAIVWSPIPGGAIGAAGATYVALAIRRFKDWSALRRVPKDTD